jgi:hypothetical protein
MNALERRQNEIESFCLEFPRIFKGSPPRVGFFTPRGWDDVLRTLFRDLDLLLDDRHAAIFRFEQIKEKFGGLRVYYSIAGSSELVIDILSEHGRASARTPPKSPKDFPSQAVDDAIARATDAAAHTCESCGRPGKLVDRRGWLRVCCEDCASQK